MLRTALTLFMAARAAAHGSGAWLDAAHVKPGLPQAGMRYISEGPPHELTMVGSDDGLIWWSLSGFCSSPEGGSPMTLIHFDFSPKGGPADLVGKWTKSPERGTTIEWPDGNAWKLTADTFDSNLVKSTLAKAETAPRSSGNPLAIVGLAAGVVVLVAGLAVRKAKPGFTALVEEEATQQA